MRKVKGRYKLLFTAILTLALIPAVIAMPGKAQAFGSLAENGTAAFMGIGITPTKILHVSGTGPGTVPLFQRASDSAGFIIERTSTNRWVLGVNESPTLGNGFVLSTIPTGNTSVPRLLVTQEGYVGIGTTNPGGGGKLQVVTDIANAAIYGANTLYGPYGYLGGGAEGVYGQSGTGSGVRGESSGGTGVRGESSSNAGYGVYGKNWSSGDSAGVYGEMGSDTGAGVSGKNTGSGPGVHGKNTGSSKYGYLGGSSYGAYGSDNASGNYGYLGSSMAGVYGGHSSGNYGSLGKTDRGVYGFCVSGTSGGSAVEGKHESGPYGLLGTSEKGVYGAYNDSGGPYGHIGSSDAGIYGSGSGTYIYAGKFSGKVMINGSLSTAYQNINNNYTLTDTDSVIAVTASGSGVTIGLPNAFDIHGRMYTIKKVAGDSSVTIDGFGDQTIDGQPNYVLTSQYQYVTVVSKPYDPPQWFIVANGP